jgi:hypothetical protein
MGKCHEKPNGSIPLICDVVGLASITAAGFVVTLWLALLILGLSLLAVAVLKELSERRNPETVTKLAPGRIAASTNS